MDGNSRQSQSRGFWKIQNVARWGIVFLYAGFIFYLSHQSSLNVPSAPFVDKVGHLVIYSLFGILVANAFGRRFVVAAVVAATLYGLFDEFHQSFVPGRVMSLADLMADSVGGFFGGIVFQKMNQWPKFFRISRVPLD